MERCACLLERLPALISVWRLLQRSATQARPSGRLWSSRHYHVLCLSMHTKWSVLVADIVSHCTSQRVPTCSALRRRAPLYALYVFGNRIFTHVCHVAIIGIPVTSPS